MAAAPYGVAVTAEPHPHPERAILRLASPVLAALLTVLMFTAMLGLRGSGLVAPLLVALVLQFALIAGRGLYLRHWARARDRASQWHEALAVWSTIASATYLLGGTYLLLNVEDTRVSAAFHIGGGFIFALVWVVMIRPLDRPLTR